MGTIMEMRRLTEEIEKEKRAYLKPSWTKDSRDQEDLEDLRGYNTKLGEAHAMHRWNVQRGAQPTVSPNHRPGQLSQKTSVIAELAQGVPTELSKFQVPGPQSRRFHASLESKPTVHHRSAANIDPRLFDEKALTKLHALGYPPPLPPKNPPLHHPLHADEQHDPSPLPSNRSWRWCRKRGEREITALPAR